MMDFPLTLGPMLDRAARLYSTVEIVSRMPDHTLHRCTYSDVKTRAHKLARALLGAGLQRGERVATLMWNHSVHLEAYFGIPLAGGVIHTLNLRLPPQQLAIITKHARDRFLIVDDVLLPLLEAFISDAPFEQVFVHRSDESLPNSYVEYESLLDAALDIHALPQLTEENTAAMSYTSGTTGDPKGVIYSHRALVLHSLVLSLPDVFSISQNDTVLPVVPMFHVNAWGFPYAATMVGAKQVLPGPHLDPESLLELCERERVTLTAGVPTVWMSVCAALDKNPTRWRLSPGLRLGIGGSAASEALIRKFDAHKIRVLHAWGLTETAPLLTVSTLKPQLNGRSADEKYLFRAAQGLPVPFVEVRVVSDAGEVPADGKTIGEAQARGPWVASSYFNTADLTEKWTADGWFRTGDVVTCDDEGYIRIVDRMKDLIKSGGEWISSVDLENSIVAFPGIKEVAVIPVPHAKWGERPVAVVVAESNPTQNELNDFLANKFAKWQLPASYIFVNELPHTSTGKLLKSALRDRYRSYLDEEPLKSGN